MNPLFLIDFYKVGHVSQYPSDTTQVWSNWTPRYTRTKTNQVVFFGLQYFLKAILQEAWQKEFFDRPLAMVLSEYRDVVHATLGVDNPRVDHIVSLHTLGYLPLQIYAIPEGFSVDVTVPALVITNTHPSAFWLPNYIETILSNILWKPCTSATTAREYRKIFAKYALMAGEKDLSFVDWMGHDFSFRGMSGVEDATLSGMGHLLSFSGTDTIPAILAARKYYGAPLNCGGSVPATEHSVMSAGGEDGEFETFKRLLTETYPSGIVSIVSDTWDLWKVLTDFVPRLRNEILARDGKMVIRPDSGDPLNILCGDGMKDDPARSGVLKLLARHLGVHERDGAFPCINKAGAIYGDSITLERAENIMARTVRELRLSPYNVVLGIGSFAYEYVTRDTYGFAMKATAVQRGGQLLNIFKKPVTDDGGKFSLRGIPAVYRTEESTDKKPRFFVTDRNLPSALDDCEFSKVFEDGKLLVDESFETIRQRVRA